MPKKGFSMIDYAVITGGSSGIGQAAAIRLAAIGVPVLLVGRRSTTQKTLDAIANQGGSAEFFECDLSHYDSLQPALGNLIATRSPNRIGLVLAASVLGAPAETSTAADYEKVFRVNVAGNTAVFEACLPWMRRRGFGRAVFFAGGGAAYGYPAFPAYALSKVSTVRLVENLAARHPAAAGFSFVCLAPGAVETPMLAKVRAAGGEVKTKTDIGEPVRFIENYFDSLSAVLHGRYLHVRDEWPAYLAGTKTLSEKQFFLRRIE